MATAKNTALEPSLSAVTAVASIHKRSAVKREKEQRRTALTAEMQEIPRRHTMPSVHAVPYAATTAGLRTDDAHRTLLFNVATSAFIFANSSDHHGNDSCSFGFFLGIEAIHALRFLQVAHVRFHRSIRFEVAGHQNNTPVFGSCRDHYDVGGGYVHVLRNDYIWVQYGYSGFDRFSVVGVA
ncbi:hypothetical protein ACJJTC_016589 [Scirpophaga incertulas]